MKMKLDKIKPFNDVWYLNCMMQSIIPIVRYYQPESNAFFLNDKIIYDVKGNTIRQINVDLSSHKYLKQYLNNIGLELVEINKMDNPIDFIIQSIKEGIPTICSIDCFYESQRLDAYKKRHVAHTILLYGYDLHNKIFNIFEHDYIYGLCFKEKEIIMEELRVCMDGYAKYRPQDSMIQIVPMKNFRNQPIIENNAINRITFWEIVKASIHNLEHQDSPVLVELLSSYVKCKKAKLVIAQLNVVEMEAIKKASILMALIAKYEKTNKMKKETFDYCKKLVNELFSLECE